MDEGQGCAFANRSDQLFTVGLVKKLMRYGLISVLARKILNSIDLCGVSKKNLGSETMGKFDIVVV